MPKNHEIVLQIGHNFTPGCSGFVGVETAASWGGKQIRLYSQQRKQKRGWHRFKDLYRLQRKIAVDSDADLGFIDCFNNKLVFHPL